MDKSKARVLCGEAADLMSQGSFREAIQIYDQVLSCFSLATVLCQRGLCKLNSGEPEAAVLDFTDAIGIDDQDPDYFNNRGNAYYFLENYELAIDDYTRSLTLQPDKPFSLNGRGQAYAEMGKRALAISDFEAAIHSDGNYVSPVYNIGVLYHGEKDFPRALEWYRRAQHLAPNDNMVALAIDMVLKELREEGEKKERGDRQSDMGHSEKG